MNICQYIRFFYDCPQLRKNITEYKINNEFNTTKKVNLPLTHFKKLSNDYKINKEVVVC